MTQVFPKHSQVCLLPDITLYKHTPEKQFIIFQELLLGCKTVGKWETNDKIPVCWCAAVIPALEKMGQEAQS